MGGLAKAEVGPVTERPKGSRQPLLSIGWIHSAGARQLAMTALRHQQRVEANAIRFAFRCAAAVARNRTEALIRSGFAHRFLVAAQEVCALTRAAAIAQLRDEQEAAIGAQRNKGIAEEFAEAAQITARLRTQHADQCRSQSASLRNERPRSLKPRRIPHFSKTARHRAARVPK